jgi:hypothetical protein
VNCKDWVEQVGESNAMRFRHQAGQGTIAVEPPWTTVLDDFDARLIAAIQELVRDFA